MLASKTCNIWGQLKIYLVANGFPHFPNIDVHGQGQAKSLENLQGQLCGKIDTCAVYYTTGMVESFETDMVNCVPDLHCWS